MAVLYIYANEKDKLDCSPCEGFSYNLNCGEIKINNLDSINDTSRLNDIALEQRDDYSEYIYSLNSLFIKYDLVYNNNLSLYFLSDLSVKKTNLFDTYISICHIILIREQVKNHKISKIIFDGCKSGFVTALKSFFIGAEVEVII